MGIKARKLKSSEIPQKTELYEVGSSRDILVEEKQRDGSLDQVTLEYCIKKGDTGYFAKEYRPTGVDKEGAKVIDITSVMLDCENQCVRWHLYDIKDTLAGEDTAVKLYGQWSSGLCYLQQNILAQLQGYSEVADLGVITRCYDKEKMEHIRNKYQKLCDKIKNDRQGMTLAQRKGRSEIAKYKGKLKAIQAILDNCFQPDNEIATYKIHIRKLNYEKDQVYQMRFPV
ncbi:MAG: hypothetical protein K2N63_05840 [Lachnospiraceae bacterium]|nr:hypothetical protein [Lachnospiraceae bacterium]